MSPSGLFDPSVSAVARSPPRGKKDTFRGLSPDEVPLMEATDRDKWYNSSCHILHVTSDQMIQRSHHDRPDK